MLKKGIKEPLEKGYIAVACMFAASCPAEAVRISILFLILLISSYLLCRYALFIRTGSDIYIFFFVFDSFILFLMSKYTGLEVDALHSALIISSSVFVLYSITESFIKPVGAIEFAGNIISVSLFLLLTSVLSLFGAAYTSLSLVIMGILGINYKRIL